MKYKVIASDRLSETEDSVNEAMEEGWFPAGGIAAAVYEWTDERKGNSGTEITYMQAMVRHTEG